MALLTPQKAQCLRHFESVIVADTELYLGSADSSTAAAAAIAQWMGSDADKMDISCVRKVWEQALTQAGAAADVDGAAGDSQGARPGGDGATGRGRGRGGAGVGGRSAGRGPGRGRGRGGGRAAVEPEKLLSVTLWGKLVEEFDSVAAQPSVTCKEVEGIVMRLSALYNEVQGAPGVYDQYIRINLKVGMLPTGA